METLLSTIDAVVSRDVLIALSVFSLLAFIGTLIAIPAILIRLPPEYFDKPRDRSWMANHHPVLRAIGLVVKNGLGLIFLLAGIAMLVLPGQGILTMLIGVSLIDFPGKQTFERRLIAQPTVLQTINALRRKFGKLPFTLTSHG